MGEKERKKNVSIQLCFSLPLLFFVNPFPANELPRKKKREGRRHGFALGFWVLLGIGSSKSRSYFSNCFQLLGSWPPTPPGYEPAGTCSWLLDLWFKFPFFVLTSNWWTYQNCKWLSFIAWAEVVKVSKGDAGSCLLRPWHMDRRNCQARHYLQVHGFLKKEV